MATVLPGAFTQPLLKPALTGGRQNYDPTNFAFIGNGNAETLVCVVRTDSGVDKFDDVFTKELIVGTPGGGSTVHEHSLVTREVLGAKLKVVTGYPGTREIILALERGEVQGICGFSLATTKQQILGTPDGNTRYKIIVQNGVESHPELKAAGVPLAINFAKNDADRELLALFYSLGEFSRAYMMPPGVPEDRVKAVRTAFIAAIKDPAFQEEADKMQSEAVPQTGEELEAMVKKMFATSQEMIERLNKILQ
jgi:tripartite-type tricarboxylate transporter receptor subunit TctC